MKKGLVFVLTVMLMLNALLQAVPTFADEQTVVEAEKCETIDLNSFYDFLNEKKAEQAVSTIPVMKAGTAKASSSLTDEELASVLYAGAKALLTRIDLAGYNVTIEQLQRGMESIFWYKPDLFYLEPTYGYANYVGTNIVAAVNLQYKMSNAEIEAARVVYENKLNEIVAQVDSSWSQMEKVLFVHNWIVVNCEYDKTYSIADAYSALTTGEVVCQGYSLLFGAIMEKLGIGVDYAVSTEASHMWNVVCVDGRWYHLDATWDDPVCVSGSNPGVDRLGRVTYDYFLLTDAQVSDEGHSSWACSKTISTEAFTNRFFSGARSDCVCVDGKWYFVNENTRNLNCYDPSTGVVSDLGLSSGVWYHWGGTSQCYPTSYSTVVGYVGKVYYSTLDSIRCFDPATGEDVTAFTADTTNGYIYGMRSKGDGVVEYEISTHLDYRASQRTKCYVGGLDLVEGSECALGSYVTGVESGTTVASLIAEFSQNVEMYNKRGDWLLHDEKIKTGDRVCVVIDGVMYRDVTVAVKGDVDGRRGADSIDYIKMKLHLKSGDSLTGAFYAAADLDGNGTVDSTDGLLMRFMLKQR